MAQGGNLQCARWHPNFFDDSFHLLNDLLLIFFTDWLTWKSEASKTTRSSRNGRRRKCVSRRKRFSAKKWLEPLDFFSKVDCTARPRFKPRTSGFWSTSTKVFRTVESGKQSFSKHLFRASIWPIFGLFKQRLQKQKTVDFRGIRTLIFIIGRKTTTAKVSSSHIFSPVFR